MAQLTQFYPTDAGRALLAIASTGACKLEISKGQVSDGPDTIDVLKTKEALTGNVKDMPIISKEQVDEHNTVISTSISNVGVTTAFQMREYGLYAKAYNADGTPIMDGEKQKEILFVVATDSDPDVLYQAGSTPITLQLDVTLTFDGDMEVTVTVDPAGLVTIRKLDQHNTDAEAHANLLRVTGMTETDNGIQYTTQDGKKTDLNLWQKMKTELTGAFVPTADRNPLASQLDGIAHQIKAITGKTNWYDAPSKNLEGIVTALGNVAPISQYSVSNANAWWVKFAGEPGLIIQGGFNQVQRTVTLPISSPRATLSVIATLARGDEEAAQTWNYTNTNFYLHQRYGDRWAHWVSFGI